MKKIFRKILSWFGPKYIEITYVDPVSFEMDQLMKKHKKPSKIVTKLDKKINKK